MKLKKKKIYEWLSNQDAYTLHKPIKRRFPRLQYNISNIDDLWESDLVQVSGIKEHNDGYNFLLVVIDALSKYVWVEPLLNKSAASVTAGFKKIFDRTNRKPIQIQTDKGMEYRATTVQNLFKKLNIKFRVARSPDVKCAIAERFIRTLRDRIWRYFTYKNTKRYIDIIQQIVYAYNHTRHSGIKMRPFEVNIYNARIARENLKKRALSQTINKSLRKKRALGSKPKYSIGDYCRISRLKDCFSKGAENNFTNEIFKIKRISHRQGLYTYILADLHDEEIDGFFYPEELALVGKDRLQEDQKFKIERIVATKGRGAKKLYLVKWLNYPEKFNSYVLASDIEKI